MSQLLIKELEPEQIVIMDNAASHSSQRTKELIEFVGCQLIFLPPYSLDVNPIEKFWAHMKRWVKNKINQFDKFYEAIAAFFQIRFSC
ncbi:hypothetical protein P618_200673 [Holospora obtusa F1]|uniref:Tc1-like transposase DDE domain-containing protein n=1 Tax=Holospora obtusa F1 TaxID=1399147 RepID=W6TGT3_HOLOB|nr:hypothetical protein P618_200673 [Holospora obtusa F1]